MKLKLFVISLASLLATVSVAVADSLVAWSAFDGDQAGMNVYLRQETGGTQAIERQLTQGGTNVTPTMQLDGSIIWLAWINRGDSDRYDLHYAVLLANSLSVIEAGQVAAQDARIYSPAITISPEGTPWLAWAGFDGEDEEIRLSHYENGRWVSEHAMTDNEVADSTPQLNVQSDGSVRLSWKQTTATAVVTQHYSVDAIDGYSLSLASPSRAMIKYKARMSSREPIGPFTKLPASLEANRQNILMGYRVEVPE